MVDHNRLDRRHVLGHIAGSVGTLMLTGCDRLSQDPDFTRILETAETVSRFDREQCAGARVRRG
jgi:hypothetical protein